MNLDDRLREKISESAIILEANRDVGPRKYEIALNLFLDDVIPEIKQAFADAGYVNTHLIGDVGDAYYVCPVCGNHVQEKFQQLHATKHDKPDEQFNKMMQEMVNLHANMKHEMIRLGMTPTPRKASGIDNE